MLSVIIKINGKAITGRSCVNVKELKGDLRIYQVDDGRTIKHKRSSGAVKLAIKLLKGIKEVE